MILQVKLFAAAMEVAGSDAVSVELPAGSSVAELRRQLVRQIPTLGKILSHSLIAVEAEYAPEDQVLLPGAEVACIPPVSGG